MAMDAQKIVWGITVETGMYVKSIPGVCPEPYAGQDFHVWLTKPEDSKGWKEVQILKRTRTEYPTGIKN